MLLPTLALMRRIINIGLKCFLMPLALCPLWWACGSRSSDAAGAAVAEPPVPIPIHRLDKALARFPALDAEERDSVLSDYAGAVGFLFGILDRPVTDSSVVAYAGSRAVQVFEPDIFRYLSPLDSVESVLGVMEGNMSGYDRLSMPAIYGIVSPYNQRVFMADSILLLGLNHYLGPDYEGYRAFPQYQRERKHVRRIPYDVAEACVARAYPMVHNAADGVTALERMLYEGSMLAVVLDLLPDASEADVLGYDKVGWDWAVDHEADLWRALISGKYLYSVSPAVADRMIGESPSTSFLLPGAPGRIGRFIGLRIAQSYMRRNPDTDPEFLLSPEFYGDISTLAQSGYAPR